MKVLAHDLYPRLVRVKLQLDEAASGITAAPELIDLAKDACLSKFHFLRLFRSVFGCTPYQYLLEQRLREARRLLVSGCSIEEACVKLRLESVGSFATLFKRRFGQTPGRYRLEYLQRQRLMQEEPGRFVPGCFASRLSRGQG